MIISSQPKIITAFNLAKQNDEYVSCGTDKSLLSFIQNTDIFSISLWFKLEGWADSHLFAFMGTSAGSTGNKGFGLFFENSASQSRPAQIRFRSHRGSGGNTVAKIESSHDIVQDDNWHHLVVTSNGTTGNIYIDNVADTPLVDTHSTLSTGDSTYDFEIGTIGNNSLFMSGYLDKCIIYNDVLTSGEVTTLFNYGRDEGLVGIGNEVFQMELGELNPKDKIGTANGTSFLMDTSNLVEEDNADITDNQGLIISSQDTIYTGLNISAENDEYINLGNDSSLDFQVGDPLSISAFIYIANGGITQSIYSKVSATVSNKGQMLGIDSSNNIFVRNKKKNSEGLEFNGTTVLNTGQWYHVCATMGSLTTVADSEIYIEAVAETKNTTYDNAGATSHLNTADATIGIRLRASDYNANIYVANLAIFNTKLSGANVTTILNRGRSNDVDYSDISGIVTHIKCDTLNPIDEIGSNNGTSFLQDASNIVTEQLNVVDNQGLIIEII